jgi:hypothetical protein
MPVIFQILKALAGSKTLSIHTRFTMIRPCWLRRIFAPLNGRSEAALRGGVASNQGWADRRVAAMILTSSHLARLTSKGVSSRHQRDHPANKGQEQKTLVRRHEKICYFVSFCQVLTACSGGRDRGNSGSMRATGDTGWRV